MTLSYTAQVLFRSSKFLSIVLSVVIFRSDGYEKMNRKTIILAILLTFGVVLFNFGEGVNSNKSRLMGFLYGFLSLLSDCLVNHYQSTYKRKYTPDFQTMLQETSFWCILFSLILSVILGDLTPSLKIMVRNHQILLDLILNFTIQTAGLFSIYFHISRFGTISTAKLSTIRKCLNVLFSFIWFGHSLNLMKGGGLLIVFTVILIELSDELRQKSGKKKLK